VGVSTGTARARNGGMPKQFFYEGRGTLVSGKDGMARGKNCFGVTELPNRFLRVVGSGEKILRIFDFF